MIVNFADVSLECEGKETERTQQIETLIQELTVIRADLLAAERHLSACTPELAETHRESARNLWHYLAMRRHDIRPLQEQLAALGLSSLGRAESHVLSSIDAVLQLLQLLAQRPRTAADGPGVAISYLEGKRLLAQRTQALLGPTPAQRNVRIMVTMPTEAASDYPLVLRLLANGMDCMRINCAHDDADAWGAMIANLRRAERELGKRCAVLMDVAGPKLRTGPLQTVEQVVKWRPEHDRFGEITAPARIWLTRSETPEPAPDGADACLPLKGEGVDRILAGDHLRFVDAAGTVCILEVTEAVGAGWRTECYQRAYVVSGTPLLRTTESDPESVQAEIVVAELPQIEQALRLHVGDTLLLTRDPLPGASAIYTDRGVLMHPAHIACLPANVVSQVRPEERVWLDDGKIGGVVRTVTPDALCIEITQIRGGSARLGAEKGINLPDSHLDIPALTAKDIADLEFIAANADLIGYSFVQRVEDVETLLGHLDRLGGQRLGIILKIETRRAFAELPHLLLAAMRAERVGVMIARGDLAVECGYERLAEVQEEVLWLCEAAHVPVIWATQVLENVARVGMPSRAEITDAAMGVRAECVMLNKGPYVVEAVCTLDDILRRMEAHQSKKSALLRQLRTWKSGIL